MQQTSLAPQAKYWHSSDIERESSTVPVSGLWHSKQSMTSTCHPHTAGMYMSWIVFIRDGNENKIPGKPDHFINFKKRYVAA